MLGSCIVKGCSSVQTPGNPHIVFYKLPWDNIQLRTQWVKLAGYNPYNADDVKHITKDHCICNLHFASNNQVLLPTLNLPKDPKDKPVVCRPNILRKHKQPPKKTDNVSGVLKSSNSKKCYTSKQEPALIESDTCSSEKKTRKEFNSSRNVLEEEPSITEKPVVQPELNNPVKPVESPPIPSPVQSPFPTFNSSISHVIPPKQKPVLIVSNHQQSVMTNLSSLRKDGKLCDAVISNGTANLKIHKMVLSAVCPKMLTIFDNASQNTFPKVTFPTTTSKEALMAFTEYLYNGVLDLDAKILGQLKTIALWLEMKDFEQLCDDQLKMAPINDNSNSNLDLETVDMKQELGSSNNAENLSFDLGVVVEECNFTDDNSTHDKEESESDYFQIKVERDDPEEQDRSSTLNNKEPINNYFQIKVERDDLEEQDDSITLDNNDIQIKVERDNLKERDDNSTLDKKESVNDYIQVKIEQDDSEEQDYASGVFHYGTNNDTFLPDFSSQDRNFSFVSTSDVQQNTSSSQLPPFAVSFKQSSTQLPPTSLYQDVQEPVTRPVGYITPTSEQKMITKEMLNIIGSNPHGSLTLMDNNIMPSKIEELPLVTMKKKYDT